MITKAVVFVDDEPWADVTGQCLDSYQSGTCRENEDDELESDPGVDMDVLRTVLQTAFSDVCPGHSVEVLFPELNECEDLETC